ncbi:hypothetical protein [Bradyrhizobium ganzhouense]|uniref:hypothetical protein n=1 Tax=Bradyrhizobium ganzhouense TaxID=1179767 RepID=UPI003CED0BF6
MSIVGFETVGAMWRDARFKALEDAWIKGLQKRQFHFGTPFACWKDITEQSVIWGGSSA